MGAWEDVSQNIYHGNKGSEEFKSNNQGENSSL